MIQEKEISDRLSISDVKELARRAGEDPAFKSRLLVSALSAKGRSANNALWVLTHLDESENVWLGENRNALIDAVLEQQEPTPKRILLQLLRRLEYEAEDLRSDFLDFCLSKINSECEPYAVRANCIHIALKICRHYPELLTELNQHLELLSLQSLSPGLKSALRQTQKKLVRIL